MVATVPMLSARRSGARASILSPVLELEREKMRQTSERKNSNDAAGAQEPKMRDSDAESSAKNIAAFEAQDDVRRQLRDIEEQIHKLVESLEPAAVQEEDEADGDEEAAGLVKTATTITTDPRNWRSATRR